MKATVSLVFVTGLSIGIVGAGALAAASAPPTSPPPTPTTQPAPTPSTVAPTTATPTTTTTTLPPVPAGVANPTCVRVVRPGDSVSLLADQVTPEAVSTSALQSENGFGGDHVIRPGDLIDMCVGNDVNDVNGASRLRPATTLIPGADPAVVQAQQQKLNDLFGQYGMTPLATDGVSGPLTRQQLCAARVFLGLPISRSDMPAGSAEEAELLALTALPVPPGAPTDGGRWALIDMTCQVMIAGEGTSGVRFVFPTSTGEPEYPTRRISEADAFRFDPALENEGWHDSSEFPASYDNPLNGNMYKPIYFNDGQAIHGASHVPTRPASKGCARLAVAHHDALIGWLGLSGATSPVWRESTIDLTVTVQGEFLPDP
jgi:hypothetical protein